MKKRMQGFIMVLAILLTSLFPMNQRNLLMNVQQTVKAEEIYPSWNSSTIYNTGDTVSYGGKVWKAQWWTQGQIPGSTEAYGVWKEQINNQEPGNYATWNSANVYNTGDIVSYGGKLWTAQWWNQGQTPGTTGEYGVWREYNGGGIVIDTQAPTVPTNLKSTSKTASSISLSWTASTDNVAVTGYEIYSGSTLLGTTTTTSYTAIGLAANTTYRFTIRAKDAAGNWSSSSITLSVTTNTSGGTTDTQAPTVPSNLKSTSKTATSISISWTASTDNVAITGYEIYSGSTLLGTATTTSYTATGLTANTTYGFTVRARDAAGNRSTSSIGLSVTTNASGSGDTVKYYSSLPVIYINTENGQAITSKEVYLKGTGKIMGIGSSLNTALYDGELKIRGRGNSTWMVAKKPYRIKLDKKTDLFGMGKNKDYVLLANYYDQSAMRNMLAFDFAGKMGFDVTGFQSVDLVVNGVYEGNYLLCEQTEIAKERVNIFDWEGAAEDIAKAVAKANTSFTNSADELEDVLIENLSWATSGSFTFKGVTIRIADYYELPDIKGGFLLELDDTYDEISKFKTTSGQPIMIKSPEYANTNKEMFNYIQSYVQAFENAVRSSDFHTTFEGERVHYSDLFDMDSLVDFWIITEVFGNLDSMFKSTYMYKDVDGLMKMGPLWDWDLCAGGSMVIEFADYTQTWQTLYRQLAPAQGQQWYRYLIKDPVFVQKAYDRYQSIRSTLIADITKNGGMIDQYGSYLAESAQLNLNKWPQVSMWWPSPNPQIPKYSDKVSEVKSWMTRHIIWLDAQFTSYNKLRSSLGGN